MLKARTAEATQGDLGNAKVYVNVKRGAQKTQNQYWFLYAYNGPGTAYLKRAPVPPWEWTWQSLGDHGLEPCGQHEGDWEHITVEIDNRTSNPERVYLSQHDGGQWVRAADLNVGGWIQFYASKYGHGAYPTPNRYYSHEKSFAVVEFRLLDDTSRPGATLNAGERIQLLAVHGDDPRWATPPITEPYWMNEYPGRWGEVLERSTLNLGIPYSDQVKSALESAGVYEERFKEFGPTPPWRKASWTGAE